MTQTQSTNDSITDETIIARSKTAKHRHYSKLTMETLLADPIAFLHHVLDVASHLPGNDPMASSRFRALMTRAVEMEQMNPLLLVRIGKVIHDAHEAGEFSAPRLFESTEH